MTTPGRAHSKAAHYSRSLKFLVDAELDLITSLAHPVINLVAGTITSHPRTRTVDLSKHQMSEGARHVLERLATESSSSAIAAKWLNANAQNTKSLVLMAKLTKDEQMIGLAESLAKLSKAAPSWAQAIHHRGIRHHRDQRSLPVGMDEIPAEPIQGGAFGGRGALFWGEDGQIDTNRAAHARIADADRIASNAVREIHPALGPLNSALREAISQIQNPDLLAPWVTPSPPIPMPSENGKPFPFHLYLALNPASWHHFMKLRFDLPNDIGAPHPVLCAHRHTIKATVWSTSYDQAVLRVSAELAKYDIAAVADQPALLW